jgi:hypothetical protein
LNFIYRQLLRYKYIGLRGKFYFTKLSFNRYFPAAGSAEKQLVADIRDYLPDVCR